MRYLVAMLLCLFLGCSESENAGLKNEFRWIAGQWQGQNGSVTMIERWKWDKTQYVGEGFEIQGSDTLFSEKIFIRSFDGMPVYVVSLPNAGLTLFESQQAQDGVWIFENEEHDFPSRIRYKTEGDSALTISLFAQGEQAHRGEHSYLLARMN